VNIQQLQGKEAALPMHMVRAPKPTRRNPNGAPAAALQIVARHGPLSADDLQARVAEQFRGYPLAFDVLLRSLTATRLVRVQSDLVCITAYGVDRVEQVADSHGPLVDVAGTPGPRRRQLPDGTVETAIASSVAPGVDPAQLTSSPPKLSSAADNRPQPTRTGADNGLGLPSRMGDKLHYRNGLVTDLAGTVLQAVLKGQRDYRPSHSGQERARPVFASNH
jgi:hypothetical protein